MNGEYLKLQVRQIENVVLIKVVNIPDCAGMNNTLSAMPIDNDGKMMYIRTSALYHSPKILDNNNHSLMLPSPKDDTVQMNLAAYCFESESNAYRYLNNIVALVKMYNSQIDELKPQYDRWGHTSGWNEVS